MEHYRVFGAVICSLLEKKAFFPSAALALNASSLAFCRKGWLNTCCMDGRRAGLRRSMEAMSERPCARMQGGKANWAVTTLETKGNGEGREGGKWNSKLTVEEWMIEWIEPRVEELNELNGWN